VHASTITLRSIIKRLKLCYVELLSRFGFHFNSRRYSVEQYVQHEEEQASPVEVFLLVPANPAAITGTVGRGLHSFTFQLNLSRV
jgi:hypothetical protein